MEQNLTYRNRTVRDIFLDNEEAKRCAEYFRANGHDKVRVYRRSSGSEGIPFYIWVVVSDADTQR